MERDVAQAEEGNPRQGTMTSHHRIVLAGLIAAALPAGIPTLAAGNSLLSGYGGPGQGSQAIIGSTLLGGGSGGGGSTGGGSDGSSGSLRHGEQSGGTGSSAIGATGITVHGARESAGRDSGSGQAGTGRASGGGASTYPASSDAVAGAGESEALGLWGDDSLYILLAFAGLALTGVLTRRLARTKGPGGHRPLKGRVIEPE